MWHARDFANKYSEEEAVKLASRRNAEGERLTMYHLSCLLRVDDEHARKEFADKCFDEALTGKELKRLVQEKAGGRRSGADDLMTGRRRKRSKGTLLQVEDMADKWLRWHKSLFEKCPKLFNASDSGSSELPGTNKAFDGGDSKDCQG